MTRSIITKAVTELTKAKTSKLEALGSGHVAPDKYERTIGYIMAYTEVIARLNELAEQQDDPRRDNVKR